MFCGINLPADLLSITRWYKPQRAAKDALTYLEDSAEAIAELVIAELRKSRICYQSSSGINHKAQYTVSDALVSGILDLTKRGDKIAERLPQDVREALTKHELNEVILPTEVEKMLDEFIASHNKRSCTNPVVIEDVEDTTSYIIISDDEVDDPENSDMEIESENEATQLPLLWDQSRSVPSERGLQEANSNVLKYFPVENNFVGEASSGKGKSVRFLLPVQENDVLSDRIENIFSKRLKLSHDSQGQHLTGTPDEQLMQTDLPSKQKRRRRRKTTENPSNLQAQPFHAPCEPNEQVSQNHAEGLCRQAEPMDVCEDNREKIKAKVGNKLRLAASESILRIQPPPIIDANINKLIQSNCDEMQAVRKSYFRLVVAHIAYQQYQTANEGRLSRMTVVFTEDMFKQITNYFRMEVGFVDYLYGLMRCEGEEKALQYLEQVIRDALKLVWDTTCDN
ncbi:7934_t:CDS:2 [Paraglomus brasilianum]|uniref:7934_t:CDS:1 n=1 Tax=Paraglomus brasilianum TaxID=144538 RepID=A0A9N9ABC7_9GLOM|nr:7934_t:CDS:2 [Paraglomus brasilianum]